MPRAIAERGIFCEHLRQSGSYVGADHRANVDSIFIFHLAMAGLQTNRLHSAVASVKEVEVHGGRRIGLGKMRLQAYPFGAVIPV